MLIENQYQKKIEHLDQMFQDEAFERKLATRRQNRTRPHSHRARSMYRIATAFSWIGNILSFATGSFFFYAFLSKAFGTPNTLTITLAIILAITASTLLEAAKRYANDALFDEWFYNRKISALMVIGTLTLAAVSIFTSFYASTQLPATTATPPALEDLATIATPYDTEIAQQNKLIEDYATIRWKGVLTSKGRAGIQQCEARKKELTEQKNKAIEDARSRNELATTQYHNTNTNNGLFLGYMSIVFEMLFCLSFFYQGSYLYKCELERTKIAPAPQPTKSTKIAPAPQPQQPHAAPADTTPPAPPAKPSFVDYENRYDNRTQIEMLEGVRECEHCGTKYVANHKKQRFCSDKCRQDHHHQKRLSNQTSLF